jgi:hypothetical protein
MRTFGLSKTVIPDPDAVHEALDKNDQELFGVAQQMADHVRGLINANAQHLGAVDARLRASVNGHIRRNVGVLKPVAQALSDAVSISLDENERVINGVALHPEMQDAAILVPPSPAYAGTVPDVVTTEPYAAPAGAPAPSGHALYPGGSAPMSPSPTSTGAAFGLALPPYPANAPPSDLWVILVDCQGLQAIAMPYTDQPGIASAELAGWHKVNLALPVFASGADAIRAWMQSQTVALARLCLQNG